MYYVTEEEDGGGQISRTVINDALSELFKLKDVEA